MIRSVPPSSYSSEVHITLRVGERMFDVSQVGGNRCLVRDPADIAPGPAELSITIDGRETRKTVNLRDGIKADSREVCFR